MRAGHSLHSINSIIFKNVSLLTKIVIIWSADKIVFLFDTSRVQVSSVFFRITIDSASFPRRLGSFMREKVTGKILIVKSRITYLITIQYCLGVHSFPKWLFHKLKLHVILTLITMYIYWRDLYDAVLQSQLSDGISEILLARRPSSATVHESSNCEMHISHQNCPRLLRPRPRLERSMWRAILSKVSSQKVPLLAQLSSSKWVWIVQHVLSVRLLQTDWASEDLRDN